MANTEVESLVDRCIREYESLAVARGIWESHWEEIAERILPQQRNTLRFNSLNSPGMKKTELQFDSTAAIALTRFTAILTSLLTPANSLWHRIKTTNDELWKIRDVRLYYEQANYVLAEQRRRPMANFSGQQFQVYQSLGAYGTGPMFVDELYGQKGLRYKALHLGQVYLGQDHQGNINRAVRSWRDSARNILSRWPNIPSGTVRSAAENPAGANQEFEIIHCIIPNEEYDQTKLGPKGMKWASFYVLREGKTMLQRGGYNTFPIPTGRYEQAPGEVYGRSPAMSVLPSIKTLNEEKKTILKAGHRVVDPVLLAHDDGIVDAFSLRPGAINPGGVNADGRPLVQALQTGNVNIGKDLMDDERQIINDAFLVSLFQILTETPQMTATEVLERTREKGILLAPTVGRQQDEYLGPLIERELDVLSQQGLLPPPPQVLIEAKGEYKVIYDNPMSQAMRAQEAAGLQRTLETALAWVNATQDPSVLDRFDPDIIIPEIAGIQGVPERWLRSEDAIAAIRQGRAQQEQVQQATQIAPGAAALISAQAKATAAQK